MNPAITSLQGYIPHYHTKTADEIGRKSGSNFLTSFRFLDAEKRIALTRVYAFFRIADDCVDELKTPDHKRAALAYWKEELEKIYHGEPTHPVMRELKNTVENYNLPEDYFTGLISGCEQDIIQSRYETMAELLKYCHLVAGLVGLTCMRIFGHSTSTSDKAAVELGLAFQLTNIIRDVGEDFKIGRIYLPREEMRRFCYSENDLRQGIRNDAFLNLMDFLYCKAKSYYEAGFMEFANDPHGRLMATKAMAGVYRAILEKIRREGYPVLTRKVSLNVFEKIKLMLPLLLRRFKD